MSLTTADLTKRLEKVTTLFVSLNQKKLQDVQQEIQAVLVHYPEHAKQLWLQHQQFLQWKPSKKHRNSMGEYLKRIYSIIDYTFNGSHQYRLAVVQSLDRLIPLIVSLDGHHQLMLSMLERWSVKFNCYFKNSLHYDAGPLAIAILYMKSRTPQVHHSVKRPVQAIEEKVEDLVSEIDDLLVDLGTESPQNTNKYSKLRSLVPELYRLNTKNQEALTVLEKCKQLGIDPDEEDDEDLFHEVTLEGLKEASPKKKRKVRKERSQPQHVEVQQEVKKDTLQGRSDGLFQKAPVVEFGEDLQYWDKPQVSGLEFKHRFLGESQSEKLAAPRLMRTVYYKDLIKKEDKEKK